jgi:hypothetical protein
MAKSRQDSSSWASGCRKGGENGRLGNKPTGSEIAGEGGKHLGADAQEQDTTAEREESEIGYAEDEEMVETDGGDKKDTRKDAGHEAVETDSQSEGETDLGVVLKQARKNLEDMERKYVKCVAQKERCCKDGIELVSAMQQRDDAKRVVDEIKQEIDQMSHKARPFGRAKNGGSSCEEEV